jgi:hypothetical protein
MQIITYDEYLESTYAEFPDVNKKSIRDIARHGLSMLAFFQTKGHDIYLNNNIEHLYYYFGQVSMNETQRYAISRRKIRRKLRLMHSLRKTPYSGYMYFGLTEAQYADHLQGKLIDRVILFKVKEELKIYRLGVHHLQCKIHTSGL